MVNRRSLVPFILSHTLEMSISNYNPSNQQTDSQKIVEKDREVVILKHEKKMNHWTSHQIEIELILFKFQFWVLWNISKPKAFNTRRAEDEYDIHASQMSETTEKYTNTREKPEIREKIDTKSGELFRISIAN